MKPQNELEAFDEIIKCCNEYHHLFTDVNIETIENYPIEKIRKALKALEVIKEKRVNVDNFLNHIKRDTNYKEYKRLCDRYIILVFDAALLTQEEYYLLKEVLL